jgi:serine/threonine-protein kinase HipA
VSFRILDEYRRLPKRPVLSQSFEDDLGKVYRGRNNELPAFFANLTPEGPLRELIAESVQIAPGDAMALLEVVGGDLPGAVEIRVGLDDEGPSADVEEEMSEINSPDSPIDNGLLRFSLAGVQLKFSVLRERDKLVLPVHGKGGEWIVKIDSSRFPHVVENEFAMLEWARAAGFDVPECSLESPESLSPSLRRYANLGRPVLAIRRYDREGDSRIHQEDFAQVVGLRPELKYDHVSYEQLGLLVKGIAGSEPYFEFVRRLAFVMASGNTDAHLKNWSVLYPDRIHAVLSPLYDQVCTIAWPEIRPVLALKFAGSRGLLQVDERSFVRLAEKASEDVSRTLAVMRETFDRMARTWPDLPARRAMASEHAEALREHWSNSPLLKQHRI